MPEKVNDPDDAYVAKLLAEDAKKASFKYASIGLQALLPKRPSNNGPKPNTRFLKNIIRETDSHNAALKRKEELEARERLRRVYDRTTREASRDEPDNVRPSKRRHLVDEDEDCLGGQRRHERRDGRLHRNTSSGESEDKETARHQIGRHHRVRHTNSSNQEAKGGRRLHKHSRSSKEDGRDRPRDPRKRSPASASRRRGPSSRSGSETSDPENGKRQNSPGDRISRVQANQKVSVTASTQKDTPSQIDGQNAGSDSDPLEMLVGPLPAKVTNISVNDPPPLRSRGRGAYKPSTSAMDAHFSCNYDPSLDLHPDSGLEDEKEDWDMALEALRDRQAWKRKQADRLREAGFEDAEIKKWEDGMTEKTAADVRWSQKGQAREWDLGKVVDEADENEARKTGSRLDLAWSRKDNGFLKGFKKALG